MTHFPNPVSLFLSPHGNPVFSSLVNDEKVRYPVPLPYEESVRSPIDISSHRHRKPSPFSGPSLLRPPLFMGWDSERWETRGRQRGVTNLVGLRFSVLRKSISGTSSRRTSCIVLTFRTFSLMSQFVTYGCVIG